MTRRQRLPAELAGMTKDELAAKYDQWVITSFSPAQVSMERALALYCPEHVVLMPDESGQLCIFRNRYGDALALVRELGVPLSDLPDDVQEEVRPGLGFDDEVTLEKWLESVQSVHPQPHCTPIRAACPADFAVLFASSEEVCYNDSELSR